MNDRLGLRVRLEFHGGRKLRSQDESRTMRQHPRRQQHAAGIDNQGFRADAAQELDEPILREFRADRYVGASSPARAQYAGIGSKASGGEDADPRSGHSRAALQPVCYGLNEFSQL